MSYMSPNFRLFLVSALSVLNLQFVLLMYPCHRVSIPGTASLANGPIRSVQPRQISVKSANHAEWRPFGCRATADSSDSSSSLLDLPGRRGRHAQARRPGSAAACLLLSFASPPTRVRTLRSMNTLPYACCERRYGVGKRCRQSGLPFTPADACSCDLVACTLRHQQTMHMLNSSPFSGGDSLSGLRA